VPIFAGGRDRSAFATCWNKLFQKMEPRDPCL
jgi:hypothetical protein